jgi:hypothetical protein
MSGMNTNHFWRGRINAPLTLRRTLAAIRALLWLWSYTKQASGSTVTTADAGRLWRVICQFGTNQDFFSLNLLWWLRDAADWVIGGPSFRRKRRHPEELRIDDVVGAWRVIALQPERKLTLLLEMKLPGAGVLEFEIFPGNNTNEVQTTAYFHPAGVWGGFTGMP